MEERNYWLGFSLFPGIGPKKFTSLLNKFHTAKQAWEADAFAIQEVIGVSLSSKFVAFRNTFSFDNQIALLQRKNIRFVTLFEDIYPQKLKKISNPPFILYVVGNEKILNQDGKVASIGIVGTRKVTQYGRDVTTLITKGLVDDGCVIVSGLAMGVDAVAHTVTIANKGKTIAVLGCGVDCCSPRENQYLYTSILASGGAIVSEIPPGMGPTPGSFPARNRIIAGLSDGVVVTEGASDSGALYTATDAFKEKRHVFAVPGQITSSLSQAPLSLLQNGASIVMSADDILQTLGLEKKKVNEVKKEKIVGETKEEQEIIDLLEAETLHIDEIVRRSGKTSSEIGSLLSFMEMKGIVRCENSAFFSLQ